MRSLTLDRPLAVFDIESTGTDPVQDRIVELCIVRLSPGGRRETHTLRINPGMPIPAGATAVHGITDADVAACPPFSDLAPEIARLFDSCDLAGYNLLRFDIPMLVEEFRRAGLTFQVEGRRVVDAQRIYHRREPRDLTAAVAFYCGKPHTDAHGAEADALATLEVLEGQLNRYPDLPVDVEGLDRYCNPRHPTWADRIGRLKWANGEIVVNFGARRGESLRSLVQTNSGYLKWILKGAFPADTQEIVRNALEGKYPPPPKIPATPDGEAGDDSTT